MGIQILEIPRGQGVDLGGALALPVNFDRTKFASKWVKEGPAVEAATEREFLVGTQRLTADGWQVWRDGETPARGKPYSVSLQNGKYVLMYRSRSVQNDVNAIYGNVGKEMLQQERRGETLGGVPVSAPGMLGNEQLKKVIGAEQIVDEGEEMNKVSNVEDNAVIPAQLETAKTET